MCVLIVLTARQVAVKRWGQQPSQSLLRVPQYFAQFDRCAVVAVSLAPDCSAVSAVVRVVSADQSSVANCLLVWARRPTSPSGEWQLVTQTDLRVSERSDDVTASGHHRVLTAWTGGSLLVAAAMGGAPLGERVKVAEISTAELLAGTATAAALTSYFVRCPAGCGLSSMRVLPELVRGSQSRSVLLASQSKLFHVSAAQQEGAGEVLWSDVSAQQRYLFCA